MTTDGLRPEPSLFDPVVPPRRTAYAPSAGPAARLPAPPSHRSVADPPPDHAVLRDRTGWLGVLALGSVAVWRIATAGAAAPATGEEARLADGAYTVLHLPTFPATAGDLVEIGSRFQLTGYAWLTGALNRHDSVTGAGRELLVVALCATIAALLVLGRRSGVRPAAAAIALAGLVLTPPAVAALAVFSAGLLGAAWTVIGAALLTGTGPRRVFGAALVLVGVITAPLVAVPVAVAVVGATARRWAPTAAVALSLASAAVVLVLLSSSAPASGTAADPVLLLLTGLIVVTALALPGLRLAAATGASALLVCALPWAPSGMLVPTLILTAGSVLAVAASRPVVWTQPWTRVAGSVMVVGVAAAVVTTGLTALRPPRPDPAHLALAGWITSAAAPDATIDAQPGVRADLVRDGIPVERIVPGGSLVVAPVEAGADDPGQLARFGDAAVRLGVFAAGAVPAAGIDETAARAAVGRQLAANPNLSAPTAVRDALSSGSVDARVLVLLAGLAGRGPVSVDDLPAVAGESALLPLHRATLHSSDPAMRVWLAAQRPPFAPTVSPDLTTLTWPVPTTTTLLTP